MPETMIFPRTRQGVRDLDAVKGSVLPISGGPVPQRVNVGDSERWLAAAGGGALMLFGLGRGSLPGILLALAGGSLLYRALTGHCHLYQSLGINTAGPGRQTNEEIVYRAPGGTQ